MTGPFISVPLAVAMGQAETDPAAQPDPTDKFIKFFLPGALQLTDLLAKKRIQPRDLAVLIAMASEMQIRSGRTAMRSSRISELLNVSQNHIKASIKRLRQACLIVRVIDNRTHVEMYLMSPYLFSGGSEKQRGFQIKNYQEAIMRDDPRFSGEELDDLFDHC